MGSWRKFSETAKQKWGLSAERDFQPTSNARNEEMFREATNFEQQLRVFEKDLKAWQKEVDDTFKNLKSMMLSPLPRVYDVDPENRPHALGEQVLIGGAMNPDCISAASMDVKQRLDAEVLKPIKDWTLAYNIIKDYMKKLEELRLTVDSRRRTVRTLEGRLDRTRSSSNFQQHELDELDFKVKHKQDKMSKDQQQYKEKEQQLYSSLSSLIQDTSVLKEYAAAAVLIMRDCFDRAYAAFDADARDRYGKVPVPNLRSVPTLQEQKKPGTPGRAWGFMDKPAGIGTQPQPDTPASADQHGQFGHYPGPQYSGYDRPESPYRGYGYAASNSGAPTGYGY